MGTPRDARKRPDLPPCPMCGAVEVIPVVFGLPGPELVERANRGEVSLGGCMPLPDVLGSCKACGHWRTR